MDIYSINDDSPRYTRKPKECIYNPCDFETVGKCPRCDTKVVYGIGSKNTKCPKCELLLCWNYP